MDYLSLTIGSGFPQIVNAVVEVPGGQSNKYEYDPALKAFRLDRPLFSSVYYPGDYGFIPSTRSHDGDALDILILLPHPTFAGCLVEARPVGVLQILDRKVSDEKILAVADSSPVHKSIHNHTDFASHVLREIEHFFSVYKTLEGKQTEVRGWRGSARARQIIGRCHQRFKRARKTAPR